MELTDIQRGAQAYRKELEIMRLKAKQDIKDIDEVIKSMQNTCSHVYEWVGNNHNDDIEECIICGHSRTV